MGEIVDASKLQVDDILKYSCPIIVVKESYRVKKIIQEAFEKVSLNLDLANRLLAYDKAVRAKKSEDETNKILKLCEKPIYLEDYEMLFTPDYELDVLRYFCETAKKRRIAIKWCGELVGTKLIYSEPGYEDYRCYDITKYDVLCVK